ncbi:MAG: hypothetical protein KAS93_06700 [Gammaproteobacteria bacterium]|nr:hypothetical protein [Gammaproteobacteria bacterium]
MKNITATFSPAAPPHASIRIDGDTVQHMSAGEAEFLVTQLNKAINLSILAQLGQTVTPKGLLLESHNIRGIQYFTCPNQH